MIGRPPARPGGPVAPGPAGIPGVPSVRPLPLKPRKVRGGVKLSASTVSTAAALSEDQSPGSWVAQRWVRLMEQAAEGSRMVEGLEYAKLGQTRRMSIGKGGVDAAVQGRAERGYQTRIVFDVFDEERWEKVVGAMASGAIYTAKLLSGELPQNIEDVFAPLGLKLLPVEAREVKVSCTCGDTMVWCKHVCCIGHLLASRLRTEPFLMFGIRGMDADEIRERLRERRAVAGAGVGSLPVYTQQVPGVGERSSKALEQTADDFWDAGPSLKELELPMAPPPVSHPLLRRLGSSPFQGATFPLVGLLASCYEVISEDALKDRDAVGEGEPAESQMDDHADDDAGDDETA